MSRKPIYPLPEFLPAPLAAALRIVSLKKGETLFRLGEPVAFLAYVLTGELKAVRAHADGAECVMVRSKAGEFFAESALAAPAFVCDGVAVCASRVWRCCRARRCAWPCVATAISPWFFPWPWPSRRASSVRAMNGYV